MNLSTKSSSSAESPDADRVQWLREQIAELRKRWPPHSVPPSMLQRLDELEEALEIELQKSGQSKDVLKNKI